MEDCLIGLVDTTAYPLSTAFTGISSFVLTRALQTACCREGSQRTGPRMEDRLIMSRNDGSGQSNEEEWMDGRACEDFSGDTIGRVFVALTMLSYENSCQIRKSSCCGKIVGAVQLEKDIRCKAMRDYKSRTFCYILTTRLLLSCRAQSI